jgi:hypothetical protein
LHNHVVIAFKDTVERQPRIWITDRNQPVIQLLSQKLDTFVFAGFVHPTHTLLKAMASQTITLTRAREGRLVGCAAMT